MFGCFKKTTLLRQISEEIATAEVSLLQWQTNAEDTEAKAKQMRINIETIKIRLKRLRSQLEEARKSIPSGMDVKNDRV